MRKLIAVLTITLLGFTGIRSNAQQTGVSNFSALLSYPSYGSAPALGFVLSTSTEVLIRVVGPSLIPFGVPNTAPNPTAALYNASGTNVLNQPGIPIVPLSWSFVFSSVGAFPLVSGAADFYRTILLPAGAYSLVAMDKSAVNSSNVNGGSGGTVLVEVYFNPNLGQTAE